MSIDRRRRKTARKKSFLLVDVCFVFITVGEVYQLLLLNRNYLNSSNKMLLSKPSIVEIIFLSHFPCSIKTLFVINEKVTCSVNK